MGLADNDCIPCRGGVAPVPPAEVAMLLHELEAGWQCNGAGHLERTYRFGDFSAAMAFANRVAAIAEGQGHHPDLAIAWGQCRVEIWTHKIAGLTPSDFFFAAKADRAYPEPASS
ncbi:MAG: 4a-hydroxytetrahydrobiopterin dehydratase [Myxococcales bacterium]|nr:4a-hydroxytetrahydrobiopterin dehydratase [Myxococcales bacterium]